MAGERFEIHYANGKIQLATSLPEAERKVIHEASDERMHGLLPATILTHPSDIIRTGEPVKTMTTEDVEALTSPATVTHQAAANHTRRRSGRRAPSSDR